MALSLKYFVYFLVDPLDPKTGYLGYTANASVRLKRHYNLKKTDHSLRANWIREIKIAGLKLTMNILEEYDNEQAALNGEVKLITIYRNNGYTLLNSTRGGERGRLKTCMFTEKKQQRIITEYIGGKSLEYIGNKNGCSSGTISNILDRHGVHRREPFIKALTEIEELNVCIESINGKSARKLGKEYRVAEGTILKTLSKHNVYRRSMTEACKIFTAKMEQEICHRYEVARDSLRSIGKTYGVGSQTIWNVLTRNDIRIRTPSEAQNNRYR
jgi:lambda repressor-like predicted transcriptional regulator/predicted GIY-YIG superfamily endonuclease